MSIGPGRPGEIEPPGHPFFGSGKEMKTHFVLPRRLFETPLNRPARSMLGMQLRQTLILFFISGFIPWTVPR
jgi:hypothetical protein